jgi:arginase family enzyme
LQCDAKFRRFISAFQSGIMRMTDHKRIALLGAPVEVGASQRGTLMGPASLRTAGLATLLQELGFAVEDHGDLIALDRGAEQPRL